MARRFSEDEARRIFARVAERQSRTAPHAAGLSLDELEEAARAAGLDPALVVQAAAELDGAAPARSLAGAPVEVRVSRVVPGELTDDVWAGIVADARLQFRGTGTAGQVGRTREWTVVSGGAKNGVSTHLSAEPVAGGIRITLAQSIRDMVLGFSIAGGITGLMAVFFSAMALAGVDPELWIPAMMMLAMALLFGLGTRVGAQAWQRQRSTRFETLLDRFELIARDRTPAPDAAHDPAPREGPSREARLRFDLGDDAPLDAGPAGTARRTRS